MTDLIVDTKYGKVEGFEQDGIRRWYGIPFAQPPLGHLRFRRAVECEPWEEIKKCTTFGPRPCQFKLLSAVSKPGDSEDCLYLNIWRRSSDEKKLPVYVWIHGGYLHCVAAHDAPYSGECFAEDGVLFVSFDYRLGPLGCYDFSIYNKEAFDSNCTLSDEIMALRWIKENIEAFGGDPDNITINGESAGGASVLALLACPSAKGLFHKAISQSGYPDGHHSARSNKLLMDMFLEYLNIKASEVEKIKELDIKTLQDATAYVFKNLPRYPGLFFPSFVYDDLLPEDCYKTLRNGSDDGVKLILGTCKNEATFINLFHECPKNKEEVQKMFENNQMSDQFKEIEEFYYNQKKGGDSTPTLNFSTDYVFLLGSLEVADILSRNHQDVWMYRFDYMPPLLRLFGLKSTHGIDIQMTFKQKDLTGNLLWFLTRPSSYKILYNSFHNSWISFAKTGDPNGDHLTGINWEKYDEEKRKTLIFDRKISVVENPEKEKIDLWQNVIKTHRFYV